MKNTTGFCAESGCDSPRLAHSPYCKQHKELSDLLSTTLEAVAFGFKGCERGDNLQMTLEQATTLIRGSHRAA